MKIVHRTASYITVQLENGKTVDAFIRSDESCPEDGLFIEIDYVRYYLENFK